MKLKIALALLSALFLAQSVPAQGLVENEFFSLDLPEGWEAAPARNTDNGGLDINIPKSSGDCLITINIMPYTGGAEELARKIGETMAAQGMAMGELRRDGEIWQRKFRRKDSGGILFVGANGREGAMTAIYGSSRLQREAEKVLRKIEPKDPGLFPSFE